MRTHDAIPPTPPTDPPRRSLAREACPACGEWLRFTADRLGRLAAICDYCSGDQQPGYRWQRRAAPTPAPEAPRSVGMQREIDRRRALAVQRAMRQRALARRQIDAARDEAIVAAYTADPRSTLASVARRYGVSKTHVGRCLQRAGLRARERGESGAFARRDAPPRHLARTA